MGKAGQALGRGRQEIVLASSKKAGQTSGKANERSRDFPHSSDRSPDGADRCAEYLGAFDLTLALVQEGFKLGQGLPVQ